MATELEILRERITRLENIVLTVLPTIPHEMASPQLVAEYDAEKERLRAERPDGIIARLLSREST